MAPDNAPTTPPAGTRQDDRHGDRPRISVVGAGVTGLTCAVRLAEAGYPVDVLARDLPLETTSAIAGGHWGPFLAEPPEAVERWSRRSFDEFQALSAIPGTGVAMRTGYQVGRRPAWAEAMRDLIGLSQVTVPAPGHRSGWQMHVPLVNMPVYLTYLMRRLRAADGTITRLPLTALPTRGLVVNCTGLAARSLSSDPGIHPVRGQVLLLSNPGLTSWWVDDDANPAAPTYVFPHPDRVVVGGTVERDQWSTTPDPQTARQILGRAVALVPELAQATVIGHRVGLRPARSSVRLSLIHI